MSKDLTQVLANYREGKMVIVTDHEGRENEADLVIDASPGGHGFKNKKLFYYYYWLKIVRRIKKKFSKLIYNALY